MNQNPRIGQRKSLFGSSRSQQHGRDRSGLAHTGGHYVRPDILHRIVNGHACGNRAARRIDIELDIAFRIFRFEKEQLGGHEVGDVVVDGRANKQDMVLEQPRINVIGALAPGGLLDHHGDECRGAWTRIVCMCHRE